MRIRRMMIACLVLATLGFVACTGGSEKAEPEVSASPAATATGASGGPATTIKGKVTLLKKPAPARPIKMNADPGCLKANNNKTVLSDRVVVSPNLELANVFVYVKNAPKSSQGASSPVTLDQKNCMYEPKVMGVLTNQTIQIINSDPLLHNVHSMSKKNTNFNVGMGTQGQMIEKKFSKPEVMIKVKCDVHGWMSTYIGVLDHPHFAVTAKDGSYTIPGVPGGEYELVFWHEKYGEKTQTVKLNGGEVESSLEI